jgi:high-affinity iron transporter
MHTLIGYTDQPTEMQLLVYVAALIATFMLMGSPDRNRPKPAPAVG